MLTCEGLLYAYMRGLTLCLCARAYYMEDKCPKGLTFYWQECLENDQSLTYLTNSEEAEVSRVPVMQEVFKSDYKQIRRKKDFDEQENRQNLKEMDLLLLLSKSNHCHR